MKDVMLYVDKVIGVKVDWDGRYGAQCVDLARSYWNWQGLTQPRGVEYAKEFWAQNDITAQFTRENEPKAGDTVIYGWGTAGHIAVVQSVDEQGRCWVLEQDGDMTNSKGARGTMAYLTRRDAKNGVLGYLRIKEGKAA